MATKKEEQQYNEALNSAPGGAPSKETVQAQSALTAAEKSGVPQGYKGIYEQRLDNAIGEYLNGRGLEYNPEADKQRADYINEYQGNLSLGREQSKGLANTFANGYKPTYANAVASEVYNQQSANIANAMPELDRLYEQEQRGREQQAAGAAQIYGSLDSTDYQRGRDSTEGYKNYLNALAGKYNTARQNDIQLEDVNNDIYNSRVNGALNNLSEARSADNANYLYNTQSADSAAKISLEKAQDSYNASVSVSNAAAKAKQTTAKQSDDFEKKEAKRSYKKFIEAYNLKDANEDYQLSQIASGYYHGRINLYEMEYIADALGVKISDINKKFNEYKSNGGSWSTNQFRGW